MILLLSKTASKKFKYGVFSDLYFPALGLHTEIYGVNLHICSKYRKVRTRKNSTGKYEPEKKLYLEAFHAVHII